VARCRNRRRTRAARNPVVEVKADGKWINGAPASADNQLRQVGNLEQIQGSQLVTDTGSLSPCLSWRSCPIETPQSAHGKPPTCRAAGDKVTRTISAM